MKNISLTACIATLLAVSLAHAQAEVSEQNALGLGWHGCSAANPVGAVDVRFACETEAKNACRSFRLLPTFVSSITDAEFAGSVTTIEVLIGSGPTVGQWWAGISPGACRTVDAVATGGYVDAPLLPTPVACHNLYPSSSSTMRGQVIRPTSQPNRFQIVSANSVYPYSELTTGERAYAMQLELKTMGTLADCDPGVDPTPVCTEGCSTPTCFVLSDVSIYMAVGTGDPNPDIIHYSYDGGSSRNWVTYQGGSCDDALGITPVRASTWGAIKALYR